MGLYKLSKVAQITNIPLRKLMFWKDNGYFTPKEYPRGRGRACYCSEKKI